MYVPLHTYHSKQFTDLKPVWSASWSTGWRWIFAPSQLRNLFWLCPPPLQSLHHGRIIASSKYLCGSRGQTWLSSLRRLLKRSLVSRAEWRSLDVEQFLNRWRCNICRSGEGRTSGVATNPSDIMMYTLVASHWRQIHIVICIFCCKVSYIPLHYRLIEKAAWDARNSISA